MYADNIEHWTGDRPVGCPWRAFSDPSGLVQTVLEAYRFFESGQLDQYWGADPPRAFVDGVAHYHVTVKRIQAKQLEQERKEREKKRRADDRRP